MVTADNITDDNIRDYARDHWRDPWKGGGPGRGTVNDGMAIALSTSHPESRMSARAEFARLINMSGCGFGIDGADCYACELAAKESP